MMGPMEARLDRVVSASDAAFDCEWRRVVFCVERARRALPYVARVLRDAAEAYMVVRQCRHDLEQDTPTARTDRAELCRQRDAALGRLNSAIDECNALGADLIDIPAGLVRFWSELDGKPASLHWQLGDPIGPAWPEPAFETLDPADYAATR